MAHLATLDNNQPRVRMMALIAHNNSLWLATKNEWDKINQIRMNDKVEMTVPAEQDGRIGCIRITATAEEMKETKVREQLAKVIPWFDHYWTNSSDRNFVLLRIHPTRMLFDHPVEKKKYHVSLA